jgi:hypothetical protein
VIIRADHVAGAAFVAFGVLIIALSGDLPFGDLAMPGAGFMPVLIAVLMMILGGALFLRARDSAPFVSINWSDSKHAFMVMAITAVSVALYERLGFAITMLLMILGFLIIIERRNPIRAAIFAVGVVAITLTLFVYALQTPLAEGPFGF